LPKLRLEGARLTVGTVPVPVTAKDCGLPSALSLTVTMAFRVPTAEGAKVTLMVQLAPVATVLGETGQLLDWLKSPLFAPLTVMTEIVNGEPPLLVKVTVWAVLVVPTF